MRNLHHASAMLKRRKRIILLACGVIAIWLAWALIPEREPKYNGHTLSEWALAASPHEGVNGQSTRTGKFNPTTAEVRTALIAIGTNNLPLLVRRMSSDQTKGTAEKLIGFLPEKIRPTPARAFLTHKSQEQAKLAYSSVRVFAMLGPLGTPAIPQLVKLLNGGAPTPAFRAMGAAQ